MTGLITLATMLAASAMYLFGADIIAKRNPDTADTVRAVSATVMALASIAAAIASATDGDYVFAGIGTFGAAAWTWIAWMSWNRRNRRRRPSRVLAKVRDLGHRLVVAPVSG